MTEKMVHLTLRERLFLLSLLARERKTQVKKHAKLTEKFGDDAHHGAIDARDRLIEIISTKLGGKA